MFSKSISPTPLSWGYQEIWNDAYGSHSISAGQPWPTLSENDVKRSSYHDTTATATRSNFSKVLMQVKFVKHYHIKNNLTLINPLRIFFSQSSMAKEKLYSEAWTKSLFSNLHLLVALGVSAIVTGTISYLLFVFTFFFLNSELIWYRCRTWESSFLRHK